VVGFGTGVNAALGIVNSAGGFPQPLIKNSTLLGGAASNSKTCPDSTGTGFGIQMTNASPEIEDSYICGGHRGLFGGVNGNPEIKDSHIEVSSTGSAFLFEKTGAGAFLVANSGVFYVGNKYTGIAGGLVCVNSYKANYTPASDGTNSATACN
jgi:hypothetical protein